MLHFAFVSKNMGHWLDGETIWWFIKKKSKWKGKNREKGYFYLEEKKQFEKNGRELLVGYIQYTYMDDGSVKNII